MIDGVPGEGLSRIPQSLAKIIREQEVQIASRRYRLLFVSNIDELLDSLASDAEVPYWSILWESAIALSGWMVDHPEEVKGKTLLEIGAGLGLCGLVAQDLGSHVVQTDNHIPALQVAIENAHINRIDPIPQFLADWRHWNHPTQYDILLGSDVVYERPVHEMLLNIFDRNLKPGGMLLLSEPFRDSGWEMADTLAARGWDVDLQSRIVQWEGKSKEILILVGRKLKSS